jgi:predicted ATPase/DNA-binding CsgD family transcriptional regulator
MVRAHNGHTPDPSRNTKALDSSMSDAISDLESRQVQMHRPPLKKAAQARLPDVPEPLIGREREIDFLLDLMRRPENRLVVLTGTGGTGKTRLALELAMRRREHHPDGIVVVELAPLSSPEQVPLAIARALGVSETADSPIVDRLPVALRGRQLLVLDNFEHVLDAAPIVGSLLASCPDLTILVTSRASLRLALEREVRISPLALPNPQVPLSESDMANVAAVRFFMEQARKLVPAFALTSSNAQSIAAICRRLDGLPLAIKLAAGRSRVLEPAAMLGRLEQRLPLLTSGQRDAPARQRTMRDTIAWSYDLLREYEQILFRRLSVCAGGFTLELAESINLERSLQHQEHGEPAAEPPIVILDTLEALIDQNLIEREQQASGDIRFTMLETIREYALEQLDASGEGDAVRAAHAAAITRWEEHAWPFMFGPEQRLWLARSESEQPNVWTALDWALGHADEDIAYRLAAANGPNWLRHAKFREALTWLDRVFALSGPAPGKAIAACHLVASASSSHLDLPDIAQTHAHLALARARECGDVRSEGVAHMLLFSHLLMTDSDAAERSNERAFALLSSLPGQPQLSYSYKNRAVIAMCRGDVSRYAAAAREAYEYAMKIGDWVEVADTLSLRAEAAWRDHAFIEAIGYLEEAILIAQRIDSPAFLTTAILDTAFLAHVRGDLRQAVRWGVAGAMGDESDRFFPDRRYHETMSTIMEDATKAIGQQATGIEVAAGRRLSLPDVAKEIHAYRLAMEQAAGTGSSSTLRLTAREIEVLRLVASGQTDAQIADALFIARSTVSRHVSNILTKLDASTRTAAVDCAYRLGVLEEPNASFF